MRIACLQFAPQVGDISNNLDRADAVLRKADPKDIDLLVLPELAFSGMFQLIWSLRPVRKLDCHYCRKKTNSRRLLILQT